MSLVRAGAPCRGRAGLPPAAARGAFSLRLPDGASPGRWVVARHLQSGPLLLVGYKLRCSAASLGVVEDHRHEHGADHDPRNPKRDWRDLTRPDGGP
jgi:hypothetical protein